MGGGAVSESAVRWPSRPRTSHDSLPSSSFSLNTIGLLPDLLPLLVTLLYSETLAVHVGIPEEIHARDYGSRYETKILPW
jgi:hypothetical protein